MISDASPLISLGDTGHLDLLHALYEVVYISEEVFDEVFRNRGRVKPSWIKVVSLTKPQTLARFATLSKDLGKGEAASIALAEEMGLPVYIDDEAACLIGRAAGLTVVRTHDVLRTLCDSGKLRPGRAKQVTVDIQLSGSYMEIFEYRKS